MRSYGFDHFARDIRDIGKISLPLRLIGWLTRIKTNHLEVLNQRGATEQQRTISAIVAAMTPAERNNPQQLLESRRMDIADAANISDREFAAILDCFETFARLAPANRKHLWFEWSLLAIFLGLILSLIGLLVGLALLIWHAAF